MRRTQLVSKNWRGCLIVHYRHAGKSGESPATVYTVYIRSLGGYIWINPPNINRGGCFEGVYQPTH